MPSEQPDRVPIEPIYHQIGRRIQQALDEAGFDQKELAHWLGVQKSTVSQWINAERRVGLEQLRRIAEFVSRPLPWLMAEEEMSLESKFAHELHRSTEDEAENALAVLRSQRERRERMEREAARRGRPAG